MIGASGVGATRTLAVGLAVVLAASALAGCVRNLVSPARDWLAGRDGIASAEVVVDSTGAWSSSGAVRGELEAGLGGDEIDELTDEVLAYLETAGNVSIRLGIGRVDFLVSDTAALVADRVTIWREVVEVDGLADGFVNHDTDGRLTIEVRALRPDVAAIRAALAPLRQVTRVSGYPDGAAIESAWSDSAFTTFGDPNAMTVSWAADCEPIPGIESLALDLVARDAADQRIVGGYLDLCGGFRLGIAEPENFSVRVPALRAELDAVGASDFPVTLETSVIEYPPRVVDVTPNDPGVYGILAVLEAGPGGLWELTAGGELIWSEYSTPAADLVGLLTASPAAATLAWYEITGNDVTVSGPIDALPGLVDEALALDASAESITAVHLGPGTGSLRLTAPDLDEPDTAEAAQALRASGAWEGRELLIYDLNAFLVLVDGVPAPLDDYTDPATLEAFLAAWAASAG
jgi:hypothetical protein